MQPLTWISMAGAGLYIATALMCLAASRSVLKPNNSSDKAVPWSLISVLFCVFALARLLQWEEAVRLWLAAEFLASQDYADRRTWQAPVVGAVAMIGFIGSWATARRLLNNKNKTLRSFYLAVISVIGLLCLITLRIISLHAIDQILYGMRLNWVIDPALTFLVAGAAFWTIKIARRSV